MRRPTAESRRPARPRGATSRPRGTPGPSPLRERREGATGGPQGVEGPVREGDCPGGVGLRPRKAQAQAPEFDVHLIPGEAEQLHRPEPRLGQHREGRPDLRCAGVQEPGDLLPPEGGAAPYTE